MKNDFRQCRWCGALYHFYGNHFCPECLKRLDVDFDIVKRYLYKYPNATITEAVDDTEVEERSILYFIKEGRLEMITADGSILCEHCRVPITKGRLCTSCAKKLNDGINRAVTKSAVKPKPTEETTKTGSKMHTEINR